MGSNVYGVAIFRNERFDEAYDELKSDLPN